MNKMDIIELVAKSADISKMSAGRAVDAALEAIVVALKAGDNVTLAGFGTFLSVQRAARTGRNPRTGETIPIEPTTVPRFRAGKALKDALK